MLMRYLRARMVLGWALLVHVCQGLFVRRDQAAWTKRLLQENIAPTPLQAWHLLPQVSRCMGCGLCDAVVPSDMQPSTFLLGWPRQPEDAPLALAQAQRLRPWAHEIMRVCPVQVDVLQVVQLIEAEAQQLQKGSV